jgi:phosphoribosyl-ATP pyrophosphohydrolase/phosphoribosyl-AMP cyclohydrolase
VGPGSVRFGPDGLVPAVVRDAGDGAVLMLAWMDAEALDATLATGEVHFHSRSRGRLWRKGETSGNVLRLRSIALDCDADALLVTADAAGPTCHRGTRTCFDRLPGVPDAVPGPGPGTDGLADSVAEPNGATDRPAASRPDARVGPAPDPPDAPADATPDVRRPPEQGLAWLEELWATIDARARTRPAGSYTARLLDGGVDAVARKVTEEATEVLMAAKDDAVAAAEAASATATAGREARVATRVALAGETADLLYHALVLLAERGLAPSDVIRVLRERHGG